MPSDSARPFGSSSLGPGTVLDGTYEILTRIGAGGMGEVFKARNLHLNTFRCIKVMRENLLSDETVRNRFLREARLATQIHHPNIAVVHDFFLGEGGSYMVTEFIDGTTVRQWSTAHGPFPLAIAADVALQVLAGLDHIHRRGLLHRDISPDNVMLTYDAEERLTAKIIDLGIAKDINTPAVDTTQVGVLVGNPKYMSPEQFGALDDKEQLDGRADLYCLGIVLYEMLLGVPPFASETPQGYIMKHLTAKPRRFAEAKPGMVWAPAVDEIIFRALEKDRKNRFADAREFAEALRRFVITPAGHLTRESVARLKRPADEATQVVSLSRESSEMATVTDVPLPNTDAEEEQAFQKAWESGSSDAWRSFLVTYAKSPRVERARKLLDETLAFEKACRQESETGFREFLKVWPEGRHHFEAEILLGSLRQRSAEQQAFEQAKAMNTPAAWQLYLATHPAGQHASTARERLAASEEEAFTNVVASKNPNAAALFLTDFPESPRREELTRLIAKWRETAATEDARAAVANDDLDRAEQLLGQLHDAERKREVSDAIDAARDRRMWEEATANETARSLRAYLDARPQGRWAADAQKRLARRQSATIANEPVHWNEAWEAGTVAAWDRYLNEHPDSPRAEEAKQWRHEAADFELAIATDTRAMWRAFLKTWPEGRHVMEAAIRLRTTLG